jgi:hypothetical protein
MALIRAFGQTFLADLVKDLGNGKWQAIARADTGRTAPGTTLIVSQSEIVDAHMDAPPSSSDGPSDLEAAMAKERETLPSPESLIAQHRENLKQEQAVSVPPDPT